jgi:hypothetical protein
MSVAISQVEILWWSLGRPTHEPGAHRADFCLSLLLFLLHYSATALAEERAFPLGIPTLVGD